MMCAPIRPGPIPVRASILFACLWSSRRSQVEDGMPWWKVFPSWVVTWRGIAQPMWTVKRARITWSLLCYWFYFNSVINLPWIKQKANYEYNNNSSNGERSEQRSLTWAQRHRQDKRGEGLERHFSQKESMGLEFGDSKKFVMRAEMNIWCTNLPPCLTPPQGSPSSNNITRKYAENWIYPVPWK